MVLEQPLFQLGFGIIFSDLQMPALAVYSKSVRRKPRLVLTRGDFLKPASGVCLSGFTNKLYGRQETHSNGQGGH